MKPATVHLTHELARDATDRHWSACGKVVLDAAAHTLEIHNVTCKACLNSIAGKTLLGEPLKPAIVHLTHELARDADDLPWMACGKVVLHAPHTLDIRDVNCKACLNSVAGKKLLKAVQDGHL